MYSKPNQHPLDAHSQSSVSWLDLQYHLLEKYYHLLEYYLTFYNFLELKLLFTLLILSFLHIFN